MPELPEVETAKSVLEKVVNGRTIQRIDILRASSVPGDKEQFVSSLVGEKFLSMSRVGKFLIFHLTNDKVIISHLRMEGKYYELEENESNTKYARVVLHLDNNHKVCYDDSRCFGYMRLSDEKSYLKDKEIAKLGPEPWDADVSTIMKQVKRSSLPIKSALLSQTLMTGLGNIYVDETLFAAHIHPLIPANKITKTQWELIKQEASRILKEAIVSGGSTIKSYHPGKDIDGNFQSKLLAYGKAGSECPNCGTPFRFIKVGGRGTTFCPKCQEYHGKQIKVAIYGKIASGKSTVLNCFKEQGFATLSADAVVADLYNKKEVINKVNNAFGLKGNTIDRNALRTLLAENPKLIKKIDKIIHPLVKEETKKFLKENKGLVVAEIPLLYESKMDSLFDVIIAVDIDSKKQGKLVSDRDGKKSEELKEINKASSFDKNKNKADFIILNDADLNSLSNKTNKIINKLKSRLD